MHAQDIIQAIILGLVEGLTEFIPVSSTAHLLLVRQFLGFQGGGPAFDVLIQLGAILAILLVYFERLWRVVVQLPTNPAARRFVLSILIGFLPAAILGMLTHNFIETVLFNATTVICLALIIGGVALLLLDRLNIEKVYQSAMHYPLGLAFIIGVFQCLALVPGVSRSGATIAGALLMGCDKRSAAEYSFFLAIPVMVGAFVLDSYKHRGDLSGNDVGLIAIGFVTAFISALFVVRKLLAFVSRHGFAPFAWWRIVIGLLGLAAVWIGA
ncbi:Undecaprenyl-diphosphatase [Faunimonas pinastri]|uniref:Undecaprenyl-diphosphatase n=1 Tax=Faunimonas pinastri TaxID=1855383 RepID=A0A1H9HLK4_9HYPH|nr:undecaprenyl-diphosphate phosphatase [Faunimonas pinastri]SEQ63112.1 Undecaprenyl-diphosphatase [Faunimonas pinastri]